jgi:Domain of unknown function (DUF3598)
MAIDLQEQNWNNFCGKHLHDWHGLWTRYTPSGEVVESFQSLRSFHGNDERTEVTQTNRYLYADGRTEEKVWRLEKPALSSIFFEQGLGAFISKQFETGKFFAAELFLLHENLRCSAIVGYANGADLTLIANIREDSQGFPSKYWTTMLDFLAEGNQNGEWSGTSVTMYPDLQILLPVPCEFKWSTEGRKVIYLPDGVTLLCPEQLSAGKSFTITANWLVAPTEMQQISVNYDDSGAFSSMNLELLSRVN